MIRQLGHATFQPSIGVHHRGAARCEKAECVVFVPNVAQPPTEQNEERSNKSNLRIIILLAKQRVQHSHRVVDYIGILFAQDILGDAARFPHIERAHPALETDLNHFEVLMI